MLPLNFKIARGYLLEYCDSDTLVVYLLIFRCLNWDASHTQYKPFPLVSHPSKPFRPFTAVLSFLFPLSNSSLHNECVLYIISKNNSMKAVRGKRC